MAVVYKTCEATGKEFPISELEQQLCKQYDVALPRFGFSERLGRRHAFRNERTLHKRICDKTGAPFISIFRPEIPFTVYSPAAWWGDGWDECASGQAIDFTRPFFEQFSEVYRRTPLPGGKIIQSENCEYNYAVVFSKNCYRCVRVERGEDVLFTHLGLEQCRDCADCYEIYRCELCYECIKCRNCYSSLYSELCENSRDVFAGYNLRGCASCIGCTNLTQKKFHVFNTPVSPQEFQKLWDDLRFNRSLQQEILGKFEELKRTSPRRALEQTNSENCLGDFLLNCHNSQYCFHCFECDECAHEYGAFYVKTSADSDLAFRSELVYRCLGAGMSYGCLLSIEPFEARDQIYTIFCVAGSADLFGCVSMKKKQYCILNQQYSETEYRSLKAKLISHMKETGEWGEFFPMHLSPFPYNESLAQLYRPRTAELAKQEGLWWCEPTSDGVEASTQIPEHLSESDVGQTFRCVRTLKPYKIVKEEFEFYEKLGICGPALHPDERHSRRLQHLNPFELYERSCAKTGASLVTSYPSSSPYPIYSNEAYLKDFGS